LTDSGDNAAFHSKMIITFLSSTKVQDFNNKPRTTREEKALRWYILFHTLYASGFVVADLFTEKSSDFQPQFSTKTSRIEVLFEAHLSS
jgi:site-specific recombinase XerD